MKPDHIIAPPGTRMPPRSNLSGVERLLSVAAGTALGATAIRGKGPASAVVGLAGAALLTRGLTGAAPLKRYAGAGPDDKAVARTMGWRSAAIIGRAVTIGASRDKVYRHLRDFANWPQFMQNVVSVTEDGECSHWVVEGPGGAQLEWDSILVKESEGQHLGWESAKGASIPNRGTIKLVDAPGGRGTEVHVTLVYRPPGGTAGRLGAKLTQKEPGIQLRRDLKRLKMLIETGEVATNRPQSTILGTTTKA